MQLIATVVSSFRGCWSVRGREGYWGYLASSGVFGTVDDYSNISENYITSIAHWCWFLSEETSICYVRVAYSARVMVSIPLFFLYQENILILSCTLLHSPDMFYLSHSLFEHLKIVSHTSSNRNLPNNIVNRVRL